MFAFFERSILGVSLQKRPREAAIPLSGLDS